MRFAALVASVVLLGCGAAPRGAVGDPAGTRGALADVAWLEGDWRTDDEPAIGERWAREGGRLTGMGYEVAPLHCDPPEPRGDRTAGGEQAPCADGERPTEALELLEREGALVYVATPHTQTRTEFTLTTLEADHFVAENPAHDFPTRLEYRRDEDALHVIVSSAERRFELRFRRR